MQLSIILSLMIVACLSHAVVPESPYVTARKAHVPKGTLFSTSDDPKVLKSEIRSQLKYMIGTLNAFGGGASIDYTLSVEVKNIEASGSLNKVEYTADLWVAWNKNYAVPETYRFTLPERGDTAGLQAFYDAYGVKCANEVHEMTSFFYYYRPNNCGMNQIANPRYAVKVNLEINESLDTSKKRPEYELAWNDGAIKAVAIFGNTINRNDELYRYLRQWFGEPLSDRTKSYGDYRVRSMRFGAAQGEIHVEAFDILIGNVQSMGDEFKELFNAASTEADLIAYNGHSGLGKNIRALLKLGRFKADQYKLYYLNGCDTFSYVNHRVGNAHAKLNPEYSATKYVDFITTVMPSAFSQMGYGTARIIRALANSDQSFRSILSGIPNGLPVTLGEEDNPDF